MVELNTLKAQLQPYLDGDNKLNELNTQLVTAELEKQDLRQQLTQAHQAFLPTARQSPPHPDPDVYEGTPSLSLLSSRKFKPSSLSTLTGISPRTPR